MKDEISRVLTLVEEGKIDKEKASELITILQGKDQPELVISKKEAPYGTKMLKIRVTSQKDINVDLLIDAIENELDGEIVNITSANGDKVFVVIE
jgi:hypothetical protein